MGSADEQMSGYEIFTELSQLILKAFHYIIRDIDDAALILHGVGPGLARRCRAHDLIGEN